MSHPLGNTSKLIYPPIEYLKFNSLNSFSNFSISYFLIWCWWSYYSKSSRSYYEQFLPIGEILIIPFLYSINVPLFSGNWICDNYNRVKFMNFYNWSSPTNLFNDYVWKCSPFLNEYRPFSVNTKSTISNTNQTYLLSLPSYPTWSFILL